ncbi:MAG: sec-independent protein translocase protein TatB [Actinomycetota bacterium]|jgi:sec-independent protein translocase protein TatB|nr:sec-independent protein translocase protein TatB [Actinomycetota bacterium]MDQ1641947.1 sec-independent protein translocase protein TatB [Actinomycetota bacterium]
MMDIGSGEVLGLAVVALLVLGPDKLPKFASDAARFVRQFREMANKAKDEVRAELGPELQDISLADLNPRTLVRKHILDDLDLDGDGIADRPARGNGAAAIPPAPVDGVPPPYDADAT